MGQDYYAILGLKKGCNESDLKKAYRKLAMQWHPDKHQDPTAKRKAEEMFKSVSEAYDVLSDPEKRKIYDQFGEEGLKGTAPGPSEHGTHSYVYTGVDPSELFRKIFGSDRGFMFSTGFDDVGFGEAFNIQTGNIHHNQHPPKSTNYELDLPLSLEELYTGTVKK